MIRLAIKRLSNVRLYSEMIDTATTRIEDQLNTAWTDICRWKMTTLQI